MASGSLRPGRPIGSVRASLPRRAANFAGSARSTPVVSVRPISKISASSMKSPRLPLKVSGALSIGLARCRRPALSVQHVGTSRTRDTLPAPLAGRGCAAMTYGCVDSLTARTSLRRGRKSLAELVRGDLQTHK